MKRNSYKVSYSLFRNRKTIVCLLIAGLLVLFPFRFSAQTGEPQTGSKTISYLFYYKPGGRILIKDYKSNRQKYEELGALIKKHRMDLMSGASHLAITAYLSLRDMKNKQVINECSMHANILRSLMKVRKQVNCGHITFYFDNTMVMRNIICVKYVSKRIKKGSNILISYTLHSKDPAYLLAAYDKYICSYGKLPIMGDGKSDADGRNEIVGNRESAEQEKKEEEKQEEKVPRGPAAVKNSAALQQSWQPVAIKREFHLFLSLKTNLLYWAGITSEPRHRDIIPNLEMELFTRKHFSFSADAFYIYKNKDNVSSKTWGVSGLGVEPRYWFCRSRKFSGLYAGLYGLYGQYNIKPKGETSTGHTGDFYEGGMSLGLSFQFSRHLGIEIGARSGYRRVLGDAYEFISPHYYRTSSDNGNGLKLTDLRLLLTYRIGKNVQIKSNKR